MHSASASTATIFERPYSSRDSGAASGLGESGKREGTAAVVVATASELLTSAIIAAEVKNVSM